MPILEKEIKESLRIEIWEENLEKEIRTRIYFKEFNAKSEVKNLKVTKNGNKIQILLKDKLIKEVLWKDNIFINIYVDDILNSLDH